MNCRMSVASLLSTVPSSLTSAFPGLASVVKPATSWRMSNTSMAFTRPFLFTSPNVLGGGETSVGVFVAVFVGVSDGVGGTGVSVTVGVAVAVIVGVAVMVGVNVTVAQTKQAERAQISTSLFRETGKAFDRTNVLTRLLISLDDLYAELRRGVALTSRWSDYLDTLGKTVQLKWREEVVEGVAEAVDDQGDLLIRLADGSLFTAIAGEVTLQV